MKTMNTWLKFIYNLRLRIRSMIKQFISRIWFELFILSLIWGTIFLIPEEYLLIIGVEGLINLFITKLLWVSTGICHAHITRKILFPYIKFSKEEHWSNNAMIIALYVVIIWAWARGG